MNLTERFLKGLAEYNLTQDDIVNSGWCYCGGNQGSHHNYFKIFFNNKVDLPLQEHNCVCGHYIVENCYITDGKGILALGNCCIKRFLPQDKSGRTCRVCKKPHKNRKDNLCHNCRIKIPIRYNIMVSALKVIRPILLWNRLMDSFDNTEYIYEEVNFTVSRTFDSTTLAKDIKEYPPYHTLDEIVLQAIEHNANIIEKTSDNIWILKYNIMSYELNERNLIIREKRKNSKNHKTFLYKIID